MAEKEYKAFESREHRRAHFIRNPKPGRARRNENSYTQRPKQPPIGQSWSMVEQMLQQQQQQWQGMGPPPTGGSMPSHPPWHSAGPPATSQSWPTQPANPYPKQIQEPPLVNEQSLREFHRLHQYNNEQALRLHQYTTEQSHRQLQSLFRMPQAPSSDYVQPINHVPNYYQQTQSQFHANKSVTEAQDTIPMPNLKRQASTEINKEAKKASEDTHAMQSKYQSPVLNDPSESQRPAGKAAEPQRTTDDVQTEQKSLVMNDVSETQYLADRVAELQKNTHTMQPNHQSPIVEHASETQCLVGNAADSQQSTHTMRSRAQSPFATDTSKSQPPKKSVTEAPKKTDTPTSLKTAPSEKLEPKVLLSREHKAAIETFIELDKISAQSTSRLDRITTTASSTIPANKDNATINTKVQSKQSSHTSIPWEAEALLRREQRETRKPFHDYGFENVLLGRAVRYKCVINVDQIDYFAKTQCYSAESFAIYRCVMKVPKNFVFVVPTENRNDQEITSDTTDVVWIYHANGNHWVMVHLSLRHWRVTYYDSLLHKKDPAVRKHSMENWCGKAIDDIRRRLRTQDVSIQERDPEMKSAYSILQNDDHSCGPFALREIEKLIGIPVKNDLKDPMRIRLRHLATIHQEMKHRMRNEDLDDPTEHLKSMFMQERQVQEDIWRTEAIAKATSSPEASTTTPNLSLSLNAGSPTSTKPETSTLADLAETALMSIDEHPKQRTPRMLQELASTLKVAEEMPKRRT